MKTKHGRRSIRLKEYDYSREGAYFVTICLQDKECLLGEAIESKTVLNDAGEMVEKWWSVLPEKYSTISLDEYIIMPNHMHGIIIINGPSVSVGADQCVCPTDYPTRKNREMIKSKHIGLPLRGLPQHMQWFKTMTTNEYIRNVKNVNWKPFNKRFWQRNYYEHIVRNEDSLDRIREYIINNPMKWQYDRENPEHIKDKDYDKKWDYIENVIYNNVNP
ncbi:transposase [Candidatus Scalindua japonica]|uniref:transposase n=1 Tax=Candidatus Scalindua japonica TaxID=1284222 RepID=UPI00193E2D24|nr:transposase [Candidatus Scalindua japonica]